MHIEIATIEQAALLSELARKTFYDTFQKTTDSANMSLYLSRTYSEEIQASEICNPNLQIFIIWENKTPVGYAQLDRTQTKSFAPILGPNPIQLGRFYIDSPFHGKGYAHSLMRHCLSISSNSGFKTLWLGVWEKNFRAQRFYSKWHFKKTGSFIFPVGNDPQIDFVFERSLAEHFLEKLIF